MNYDMLFKAFPYIESDELVLKQIDKADVNDLFAINGNDKLYRYKPGAPRKTLTAVESMIGHYERDFHKKAIIFLGIYLKDENTKLVGVAEVFDFDKKVNSVTMGYTLNDGYWGRGIATKTTALLLHYLFKEIDVNRIQAFVMPINEKSKGVLLRNNFVYEGLQRQSQFWTGRGLVDLEVYSILKEEYQ